jgi:hypothetical protein
MAQTGLKLLSYATKVIKMDEVRAIQQQMEQGIDMDESGTLRDTVEEGCQYLCTLGIADKVDVNQVNVPICQLRFG